MNTVFEKFKAECAKFKQDIPYKKALAEHLGLNPDEYYFLRPITGAEELKHILKTSKEINFMPGIRHDLTQMDSHDDAYIKSGDFSINLHVHTNFSDGHLSVDEFLRQAKELADKNFDKGKSSPPLLIAITDHDCIDGAKEAVKKIAQNPAIYKNVRFVAGVELSTITNKLKNLKKPILIHTHMFCINPFDSDFNTLVNKKKELKLKLAQKTIDKTNSELKPALENYKICFSLEDMAKIHPLIMKGEDEINLPMIKYVSAKLFFEEKVLHNSKLLKILKDNNINLENLRYEDVVLDNKVIIRRKGGILKNYDDALLNYLQNNISKGITKDIIPPASQKLLEIIEKTKEIGANSHPAMTNFPNAFYEFETTLKTLSRQEFGVFGIAHPARTVVNDISAEPYEAFDDIFKTFKLYGGEKALYYEGYYQSYFGEDYLKYLTAIEKAAKKQNLIKTGGLDSHGNDIKCRTVSA